MGNKNTIACCFAECLCKLDFPGMFSSLFERIGFDVSCYSDGDAAALDADYIILFGVSHSFPEFEKLLADNRQSRPEVFLWQFEPVPFPGVSKETLDIARKYVRRDFKYQPAWLNMLTKKLVPKRGSIRNMIMAAELKGKFTLAEKAIYSQIGSGDIFRTMRDGIEAIDRYNGDWCDYYVVSTEARVEFLTNNSVPAYFAPMGYHQCWGKSLDVERTIDVAFIGNLKGRRKKQLQLLSRQLKEKGIFLSIFNGFYGEKRTELLNRCKIIIDLDRLNWEFPLMRPIVTNSCGALLITDWIGDPGPFLPEHIVQRNLCDFPDAIEYYLKNETERKKIVEKCQDFLFNDMTLYNIIEKLLVQKMSWNGVSLDKKNNNAEC